MHIALMARGCAFFLSKREIDELSSPSPPPTPSGAPTDHPNRYRDMDYGGRWVRQKVGGGRGGELVNQPYAKTSFSAAMLL